MPNTVRVVSITAALLLLTIIGVPTYMIATHKLQLSLHRQLPYEFDHPARAKESEVVLQPGDFSYHTLDGERRFLHSAKGQVVLLNRWGTWCAPCVAEMPSLQRLYDHYRDDPKVRILAVASMDTAPAVHAFALKHHMDMPLYVSTTTDDKASGTDFSAYPSTSIYDPDGKVSSTKTGSQDWATQAVFDRIDTLKR